MRFRWSGVAKRANLVEAMDGIFRPWFPLASDGADTWGNWKAVLRAMDALPMSAEEIEFFKSISGGREPPTRRVSGGTQKVPWWSGGIRHLY